MKDALLFCHCERSAFLSLERIMTKETEKKFDEEFPAQYIKFPNKGKPIQEQEYIESISYAAPRKNLKTFISAHFIDKRTLQEELEKMQENLHHSNDCRVVILENKELCSDFCQEYKTSKTLQNIKDKLNL